MDLLSLISIAIIGIIGFLSVCEIKGRGIRARLEARRTPKPLADDDWNDQNPPKSLNYNYIDWLERDLKVGKYDPDRIALGFDDTEQKPEPKPLDPEIDELPMATPGRSGQFSAEESAALVDRLLGDLNELNAKIGAKPVDDSWADVDVRDGVYGPETR